MNTWSGDACGLVDAFRAGSRNPAEELAAVRSAIAESELNAFSYLDASVSADHADVSLPFGGVPVAVKELEAVAGWPHEEASLVFAGRTWEFSSTQVDRLRAAGAVLVGQTTASEFGGLSIGMTRAHGVTRNPWDPSRNTGGSSAGSSPAVAGGLVPIATGSDGGGSIRKPAGYCGLLGLKGTAGRIPRGPWASIGPLTVVVGCQARSVRDVARWYDVCAGYDPHDVYSLPRVEGWEAGLGTRDVAGRTVAIAPNLGVGVVNPRVEALIREQAELLARDAGLKIVDLPVALPNVGLEWSVANMVVLRDELSEHWPDRADDLTPAIAFGMRVAQDVFNLEMAGRAERQRVALNEAVAALWDQVDLVISATNPDVACDAEVTVPSTVDGKPVDPGNDGVLTIPANVTGVPAISIPVGTVDGLPVGMQIMTRHHDDALLLDLARVVERERPWPLTAPAAG